MSLTTANGHKHPTSSLPPHNLEAEKSVLGAVLLDERYLHVLVLEEQLRPDHFYREQHGAVFAAMLKLHEGNRKIDHLTVAETLRERGVLDQVGGPEAIEELAGWVPAAGHAREYGQIVRENAQMRALLRATYEIQAQVTERRHQGEELIDEAERLIFALRGRELQAKQRLLEHAVAEEIDRLEQAANDERDIPGLRTGFPDLDRLLGGLQNGRLYVVAARPAMGKSLVSLQIARHVAFTERQHVLFASLEMSDSETAQRHLAAESGVNPERLHLGRIKPDDWPALLKAAADTQGAPFHLLDDGDLSVMGLRAQARQVAVRCDELGLIVVDYLQLMRAEKPSGSRVEDVSEFSRGLKRLARELKCPVMAVAQLSRAVEQRPDKRPLLSDLRESGCLSGNARVHLPDRGISVPISELVGQEPVEVLAIDAETYRLTTATAVRAFSTGRKPTWRLTTRLGRRIEATANHRFLTVNGWKRLDELSNGDRICLPRSVPGPTEAQTMSDSELGLLGHLIGDGCTLARRSSMYTTAESDLVEVIRRLAREVFGEAIKVRVEALPRKFRVYLAMREHATHGRRSPLRDWLESLGCFGLRSYEKHVPEEVFKQPDHGVAVFLRHLWATDGAIFEPAAMHTGARVAFYSSNSEQLARDVQHLLLRLGICATLRCVPQKQGYRPVWNVVVSGAPDLRRFIRRIGAVSERKRRTVATMRRALDGVRTNTNRDLIPASVWLSVVTPACHTAGLTSRAFQAKIGTQYCGGTLHKHAIGRERMHRIARVLDDDTCRRLAASDVYWDSVVEVAAAGQQEVFDLTVPGPHNFIANDMVVHNSIEADADCVLMLYRDDYYDPDSERPGEMDIIVRKNRQGRLGQTSLRMDSRLRFLPIAAE